MELTEEQKKFLADVEEEFSNRFTETDGVYWEEHTSTPSLPPMIEPWYNKQRRRFDLSRRGRDNDFNGRNRDRDQSNHGRYDRSRNRSPGRDHRGDRDSYDNHRGNSDHHGRGGGWNRDRPRDRDNRNNRDRENRNNRERGDYSQSHDRNSYR